MFVTNSGLFDTVEFSPFIGDKICRAGTPTFSISAGRKLSKFEKWLNIILFGEYSNYATKYEFLDNEFLHEAILKLPFYIRIYLKFCKKCTKNITK